MVSIIAALIVAYNKATSWLGVKLAEFTMTLETHGIQLQHHANRMDRYEQRYVEIAQDLQWLVGRTEGDRRRRPRLEGQD